MFAELKRAAGRWVFQTYKRSRQKSFNSSLDYCLKTVRTMMRKSKYCFLITNHDGHSPSARMVQPIVDLDSLDVWIGTSPALRKIGEIERDSKVTLTFGSDGEHASLVLYGCATVVSDPAVNASRWINSWQMFFPDGPGGDDFVSIRIEPSEMELMNFKRSIVPEPFGLKPAHLVRTAGGWQVQ